MQRVRHGQNMAVWRREAGQASPQVSSQMASSLQPPQRAAARVASRRRPPPPPLPPPSSPLPILELHVDARDARGVGCGAHNRAVELLLQSLVAAHVVPVVVRCRAGGQGGG